MPAKRLTGMVSRAAVGSLLGGWRGVIHFTPVVTIQSHE